MIDRAIIAEKVTVGNGVQMGVGEEVPNRFKPDVYAGGLVTIGEDSVIPDGVIIGKNTAIAGITSAEDYPDGILASGESVIKDGDQA